MKVIGLTGGIASGKSTASKFFSEWGIPVIDADQLAREVVEIGTRGLSDLIQHFGPEYLTDEGVLDREKLAKRVFADPTDLAELNNIMLPKVQELSRRRISEIKNSGHTPYMIYDAALHIETGSYRDMDALIVVATPKSLQLRRLMKRKGLTEAQALERIEAQLPLSARLPFANHVIENDDDLDAFRARSWAVHVKLSVV